MSDQAFRLRTLMHAGTRPGATAGHAAPTLMAIAGAKGGVGTTTLAVNLAVALAQEGRRTLLVDADPQRADVAVQCGLTEGLGLADVLSGVRSLHEAIRRGPGGIQVLPGRWGVQAAAVWSPRAQDRLVCELRELGQHADIVLIDLGASIEPVTRFFWRVVDEVVLVTSTDSVAVMDAYAAVKAHCHDSKSIRILTLVNQAADMQMAQDAHTRLQRACRRFLCVDTSMLGSVSFDTAVPGAAAKTRPFVVHAPDCAASQELARVATRLTAHIARRGEAMTLVVERGAASAVAVR